MNDMPDFWAVECLNPFQSSRNNHLRENPESAVWITTPPPPFDNSFAIHTDNILWNVMKMEGGTRNPDDVFSQGCHELILVQKALEPTQVLPVLFLDIPEMAVLPTGLPTQTVMVRGWPEPGTVKVNKKAKSKTTVRNDKK